MYTAWGFSGSPGSGISVGYREARRIGILYRLISALGSLSAGERAVPSVPDVAGPNRLLDGNGWLRLERRKGLLLALASVLKTCWISEGS